RGTERAVVELGISEIGEMSLLTQIAEPDVVVITNATAAHLEGLGSISNVVVEKGHIIDGCRADGTVVLNADDAHVDAWIDRAGSRAVIRFGSQVGDVRWGQDDRFDTPLGPIKATLQIPGAHNRANAAAALAAVMAIGATDLEALASALTDFSSVSGRLREIHLANGARLFDDSYNANPLSMRAAIDVLARQQGRRVLAIGDMAELGADALLLHREVLEYALQRGVDSVLVTGRHFGVAAEGLASVEVYTDQASLADALQARTHKDCVILVKGSRSSAMERVVDRFRTTGEAA
ncbi:UDP-N-acetylmuramoyl-tripeptide--D-alanyl-D-alanine ligase, partial [Gammaproteobacteria bacterium]|nr:UDP-N-acetylmuramoyl-tripeptide--D-alanyl-D-alanine ligase [Gammaproteobacteria bacterium]